MSYKILVVDDEPDVREMLQRKLLREGFTVFCAADGEEALARLASDDPDILVLDLNIPKYNGFEILKQVREKFNDRWRPVIIVSAQQDLETTKKCYQLEADHYLTKPCGIDHLLDGIRTMISLMPLRQKD